MPTTADLLRQAAAEPARRDALLLQAEGLAQACADWQGIADAYADAGAAVAAERCLVRALSQDPVEVWDHRRAARTRLRLGDPVGASATLAALEHAWSTAGETRGLNWRLLAGGFAELDDAEGVKRCLATGRVRAVEVEDLRAIAQGFVEQSGDRATARTLLERAESLAMQAVDSLGRPDIRVCWTVANAWSEFLDDDARRVSLLEAGLVRAVDTDGCLTMAQAWSHDAHTEAGSTAFARCLQKARALAVTCAEWLEIAQTLRESSADDAAIREALHQARERCASDVDRERVALALLDQLGELPPNTARLGRSPDELAPPGASSLGWPIDAAALFDWLRAQVTESMLVTIAEADHGCERDTNLAALRRIAREGRLGQATPFSVREVLSLRQWQQGLDVDHVERAFVCVVLCLAELGDQPAEEGGLEDALAVLLESCVLLGEPALQRLPGLLTALFEAWHQRDAVLGAFCLLALLLVATRLDVSDARLEPLAARLLGMAAVLAAEDRCPHPEHGFLLGSTHCDLRMPVWRRLIDVTFQGLQKTRERPALSETITRLLAR